MNDSEKNNLNQAKSEFYNQTFDDNMSLFFGSGNEELPEEHLVDIDVRQPPYKARIRRAIFMATIVLGAGVGRILLNHEDKQSGSEASSNIELNTLPSRLPNEVNRFVDNVGIVYENVFNGNPYNTEGGPQVAEAIQASGVVLSSKYIMTAGHVLVSTSSMPIANKPYQCRTIAFITPTFGALIRSDFGSFSGQEESTVPDLGILSPDNPNWTNHQYRRFQNVAIDSKPLTPGEDLFFVNYEPLANGRSRSPTNNTGPAVYGGIYEGQTNSNDYDVVTGLKSYGRMPDSLSRPGASGGAVFNSEGQIVGLTVQSSVQSATVNYYEKAWGVELNGAAQNRKISDTVVQPVSKLMLKGMISRLRSVSPSCSP